jgi:hypothetical protein
LILVGLVVGTKAQDKVERNLLLKTINYDLDVRMDYDNRKLDATCAMTVVNGNSKISKIVPILLYRLMKVSSIKDEKGRPLVYTQQVLAFEDWEVFQVNYIEVTPAEPLSKPNWLRKDLRLMR